MCTPNATSSTIVFVASKTFLLYHLFNDNGVCPMELLKGDKLNQPMLKFAPFCSLNIGNLISLFKHHLGNMGFIDSIITLKALSHYNYIQDSCFPRQQNGQKVYLFKMLVDGDGYGVDLMKWGRFGELLDDV